MLFRSELGDILFTCVNLARHLGVDAEGALRAATGKFERRYRTMETLVAGRGMSLSGQAPEVLDAVWQEAKALSAE